MVLYLLTLEPFINNINSNKNIKGIKIPNYRKEIKTMQHAADTIVIINNESSYFYVIKEFKDHY